VGVDSRTEHLSACLCSSQAALEKSLGEIKCEG
jgi:hypothetical protein